jgi:hypothetical protein
MVQAVMRTTTFHSDKVQKEVAGLKKTLLHHMQASASEELNDTNVRHCPTFFLYEVYYYAFHNLSLFTGIYCVW